MSTQVVRPTIPYRGVIPSGIHEGKVIEIKGSIPYGADVFTVNLVSGQDVVSDRPLHLSVRFSGRVVVRNHFENRAWGAEERHGPFPFAHGQGFTLTIVVERTQYRISVNHQSCWQFNHRIPIRRVSSILIDGCVQIERIEFVNKPGTPANIHPASYQFLSGGGTNLATVYNPGTPANIHPASNQFLSGGGTILAPVYNPTIPYSYPIYGGLKQGMAIYISGIPTMFAYRFTINLQAGTSPHNPPDIALHFDVRFWLSTVVRNSRIRNSWEREERDLTSFPFASGAPFELCIRVQKNRFAVELDGRHLFVFCHRLKPLARFDTLAVEGDIQVSCIRFQ